MAIDKRIYEWFRPDFIEVGIPQGQSILVKISRFSIPNEYLPPGYRGIADVDFDPVDDGVEVVLRVRVLKHEQDFKVRALKNGDWVKLPTLDFVPDPRGLWTGYLEAIMKTGDPPIAVG